MSFCENLDLEKLARKTVKVLLFGVLAVASTAACSAKSPESPRPSSAISTGALAPDDNSISCGEIFAFSLMGVGESKTLVVDGTERDVKFVRGDEALHVDVGSDGTEEAVVPNGRAGTVKVGEGDTIDFTYANGGVHGLRACH